MRIFARAALVCSSVAVLGVAIVAGTANATPGTGVTHKLISQKTVNGRKYIINELTIAPGGSTGWHYTNSTLFALVKEGTLTISADTCKRDAHPKGDMFIVPGGANHVHTGRNLAKSPVVVDEMYVDSGKPLSESAPNPGCRGIK
jgi:quercetin dioxygenase-like cupin family protein